MPQMSGDPNAPIEIHLFGPFDAHGDGTRLENLCKSEMRWLLAFLILFHQRGVKEVERSQIAKTLWPRSKTPGVTLNQNLGRLPGLLEAHADCLHKTRSHVGLDLSRIKVDVVDFDNAVKCGDTKSLEKAVALYKRGELLYGCKGEWVYEERDQRNANYRSALEGLAKDAPTLEEAAAYLRRLVDADPSVEASWRKMIKVQERSGNLNAANRECDELVKTVGDPEPETRSLIQRIRDKRRSLERGRSPASPALRLPPASPPPHNLPQPLSEFIGREEEMGAIKKLLTLKRLVTLTGAGGVGKTALALQAARELKEDYVAGTWLVELDALEHSGDAEDVDSVPREVASVLGVAEEPGKPLAKTLVNYLKHKSLLLVLDNCEHLVKPCAELASTLLRSCPSVYVLATSRQALNIEGEESWRVPSLAVPSLDPLSSVEELKAVESVRLFVSRASTASDPFDLAEQNASAVAQVCHRLDGIPLAIELAAARAKSLSVSEVASRLGNRFRLLTGGSRTALPRHQTLKALIDWSYDLLKDDEKAMLWRLSVFAGGWTLPAATAVCADDTATDWEALDLLNSLVDKSLVVYEEQDSAGRYRLLETIRQYARDRMLESGEEQMVRTRHRDYFLAFAEEVKPKLQGAEQKHWLERLEWEHDNLRAALAWCLDDAQGAEAGLRLAGALWMFWDIRGYFSEGRAYLDETLAQTQALGGTPFRATAMNCAGNLAISQGDNTAARALFEESLALHRKLRNKQGISSALNGLGLIAFDQGDYPTARRMHEEGLVLDRELDDKWGTACSLNNLGNITSTQGDYVAARAYMEESLALSREIGDARGIAFSLNNLGSMALGQVDYAEAYTLFDKSVAEYLELGDKDGRAMALGNLGNVAFYQGNYTRARALQEENLAVRRELGNKQGIAITLSNLGTIALKQGDFAAARMFMAECLTLCKELGEKMVTAFTLESFAELASVRKQVERAARILGAAETLRESIKVPLPRPDRVDHDRHVAAVREALGEETFAAAWAEGRLMSLEQAVAYALANTNTASPQPQDVVSGTRGEVYS